MMDKKQMIVNSATNDAILSLRNIQPKCVQLHTLSLDIHLQNVDNYNAQRSGCNYLWGTVVVYLIAIICAFADNIMHRYTFAVYTMPL
jgi:hypothetical protein